MTPADPLHVVVFGPARSGKTALAELLHHHLAGRGVRLFDADGQAAGKLMHGEDAAGLGAELLAADALVLVVDAADDDAAVDATFRGFAGFLQRFEDGRAFGREVGGLPVVLTLAKCDALHRPGMEPSDWLRQVEERKAEVRRRFEGWFGDELEPPADGYLSFGSLQLHLAATAKAVPPAPAFAGYADPGGSFGVSDLVGVVLPAAADHHARELATGKRLRRTAAGAGGMVLALVAGLTAFVLAPVSDPLTERVRAYQRREGPPAVRLADRALPGTRKELTALRKAAGFDRLPEELQGFVTGRLAEADAYTEFRGRFLPPRLGPAEVTTRSQMDALAVELAGPLKAPPEWADTDAGRLSAKWAADLQLLEAGERELHDAYRGRIRRADLLLLTETPPDPGWRAKAEAVLAEEPPHRPSDPLAGSPAGPGPRGKPLTWATAYAVDRVAAAKRDWDETAARLTALREVCDAVGLTAAGPLVFPDPLPLDLAGKLLTTLPADDRWKVDRFPDPVRGFVAGRLLAAWDAGIRRLRPVAAPQINEPYVRPWGELLRRVAGWAGRPAVDPVAELAAFVTRQRHELDLRELRLTLPDDLTDPPPVPAGPLVLTCGAERIELPVGPATRDRPNTVYRFTGPLLTVRPGDAVTATLPLRVGTETRQLVWPAGTGPYAFLRLGRAPKLGDAEATGARLTAPGLAAPPLLPDPGGR